MSESTESVSSESSVPSAEVSAPIESSESSLGEQSSEVSASTESVEQLQSDIQQAVEDGASKKEIQQMIKEFELKVNGKTVKAKIDLSDEEAVKRELQKAYAMTEVSEENANIKKALSARIEAWKKNPDLALKDLGIDPDKYLEEKATRELEEMKLTPEQKRIRDLEAKLAEREELERQIQAEREAQLQAQKDAEAMDFLRAEINEALSKSSFLKPSPALERRVADTMATYSEKYPNITAEQVLPVVEKELQDEFNDLLDMMPDDYIEKFFKKPTLDKIGKKFEKKAPPAPKKAPITASQVAQPTSASVEKKSEQTAAQKRRSFEDVMSAR